MYLRSRWLQGMEQQRKLLWPQILIHTSAQRSFRCCSIPWSHRDRKYIQLLPSSHLLRFGFARPNRARKQNSRSATDQVFGVGTIELPDLGNDVCGVHINEKHVQSSRSLCTRSASISGTASL